MTQVLIHDGKLDRQAAADALRQFLENVVRVSKLELKVNVRPIAAEGEGSGGDAEVLADIDGKDKEILLEHGGEVLKAFEHLALRALRMEPAFAPKAWASAKNARSSFIPRTASPPGSSTSLQEE